MKTSIALLALAFLGCTNGQGEVDVTSTNVATFPGAPAALPSQAADLALTTEGDVTLDVQKDLESLKNLGSLSAAVSKNGVTGADLSFLQHVKLTIAAKDGQLPAQLLSDADVPQGSTEVELPMLIENSQLLDYLSEGKVTVHFAITGQLPQRPLTLTHTIVAHVDVAMSGSVLKF
jgi:hypothetical protein